MEQPLHRAPTRRCRNFSAQDAESRLRKGTAFVAVRADGKLLLRTRPSTGLLGAMSEVPTSEWTHDYDEARARAAAPKFRRKIAWRRMPGVVTHVFTHFPLELTVFAGVVARGTRPPAGARWVALAGIGGEALPSVMRKVVAHALAQAQEPKTNGKKFPNGKKLPNGKRKP